MVRRLLHEHVKYRGHTITFGQELNSIYDAMPRDPAHLPIVIVRQPRSADVSNYVDYRVDRRRVLELLDLLLLLFPAVYDPERKYVDEVVSGATPRWQQACAERCDEVGLPHTEGSIFSNLPMREEFEPPRESDVGPTGPTEHPPPAARPSPFDAVAALDLRRAFGPSEPSHGTSDEITRATVEEMSMSTAATEAAAAAAAAAPSAASASSAAAPPSSVPSRFTWLPILCTSIHRRLLAH